ncbi:MAG: SDR family NAD(P)-dependent oxidoreductase [Myxococcales bacterium]
MANTERPLAVVTGASTGIGFELAKQFAENGFDLLVTADEPAIEQARAELQKAGGSVEAVQTDLATYDGVEALHRRIQALGRPVDSLVLNAGVGVNGDFARETRLEDELNLIGLNVTSVVHLGKRVVKDMVQRGHGRILIVSSIAGTMAAPLMAVYGASKAFLLSFSEALANELKDAGITVTALLPGPTETEFFARADMEETRVGQKDKDDPADVAREGFQGLMAGKTKVYGTAATALLGVSGRFLPDQVKSALHRKLAEPDPKATQH